MNQFGERFSPLSTLFFVVVILQSVPIVNVTLVVGRWILDSYIADRIYFRAILVLQLLNRTNGDFSSIYLPSPTYA